MVKAACENNEQFRSKDGRCCDVCDEGTYVKADCDGNKGTQCEPCQQGFYTATKNHMSSCHLCRACSRSENQREEKECTSQENAVCACVSGYVCMNETCDHCRRDNSCRVGEGVVRRATRTNDTVCAPCEDGTYSNVTDSESACLRHTSCEEIGRVLKTPGTPTSDGICGEFKNTCPWMLPASLWSGLVLTVLVLFVLFCWMNRRRSYRTAATATPTVAVVDIRPVAEEPMQLDLPLQATELKSFCQEDCTTVSCTVELFKPVEDPADGSTQDSLDSYQPITPFKASVSFANSGHDNGSADYCTSTFCRSHSEPQEDEWCGT
ncbi:tumor necrosis factor receptor superfamily member 5 [Nelusetta ayraudi]|uniref:tumor necrosis factor receptor superfamily member 5 n=1 Tax=Nelusetta ayraudi TaxID=303726 RepID=UPI003F72324F